MIHELPAAPSPVLEAVGLPDDILAGLPQGDLNKLELRELAGRISVRPELWEPHVAFDDEHRHYVSLYRDSHVDVWVLCWTPLNDTGWHDHDLSSGAVAVVQGCVTEHNLAIERSPLAPTSPRGGPTASDATTSTGWSAATRAACRSMPTPHPCGGWGSTRSARTVS